LFLALLLVKVGQVCSNPIATVREQVHQRCHLASAAWIPCYTKGTQGSAEMSVRSGIDGKRRGPAGSRGDRRDLRSALSLLDGLGVKSKPTRSFRARD
ncbi:hypothetical protein FB107DRAFT_255217, partial [Schizophyllum commune]